MADQSTSRTYHIQNSEKCYRFKPEALINHAPDSKGIYELVAFDEANRPVILYIGAAFEQTIHQCLDGHLSGERKPAAEELFAQYPNLYFDFIETWDAANEEDAKDVYWWLVNKNKPPFNADKLTVRPSDRPGEIKIIEA